MKMQDVHAWALTQDFGLASTIEVAKRLLAEGVDGELLSKLELQDIEQYLRFDRSTAIKIYDAIHSLLGLADVTDEFDDEGEKSVVDATGQQCLVKCCCVKDESLPGDRNQCVLVQRNSTWREWSPIGDLGCDDLGDGWYSNNWWENRKCLIPARQVIQLRTCDVKSTVTLTSGETLLAVIAIISGISSVWFCWSFIQGNLSEQLAKRSHPLEFLDMDLSLLRLFAKNFLWNGMSKDSREDREQVSQEDSEKVSEEDREKVFQEDSEKLSQEDSEKVSREESEKEFWKEWSTAHDVYR
jgi:hypothetical protein